MTKIHVFGDIGGHSQLFEQALRRIGCDTYHGDVPDDEHVVQVGDLVDRGPDSDGVVELVGRFIDKGRWTQLIGNHDSRHTPAAPDFGTPGSLSEPSDATKITLTSWMHTGLMVPSVGIRRDDAEFMVTHGGVTLPFYEKWLHDLDLESAVRYMNTQMTGDALFEPGEMLGGGFRSPYVGVTWAHAWNELVAPWLVLWRDHGIEMPWHQVHGHSTLYRYDTHKYLTHPSCKSLLDTFPKARQTRFRVGNKVICQVDPGLGKYASFVPVPMTFHDAEIVGV